MTIARWIFVAVAAALVSACNDDTNRVDWTIRFETTELRDRADLVEAEIRRGGCVSTDVFYDSELRPGGSAAPAPGELADGRWGFFARARDVETCAFVAAGCTEVRLPDDAGVVETILAPGDTPLCSALEDCVDGACVPGEACDLGFADCNGVPDDGCEADLLSPDTCGDCETECSGAAGLCGRSGEQVECLAGCPPETPTVCEGRCVDLETDVNHCGECGTLCVFDHAAAGCLASECRLGECEQGWGDCNDEESDGCETALDTLDDCGGCGEPCVATDHAVMTCATGACDVAECTDGYGNCDGQAGNGCEDPLDAAPNCGACGVDCVFNGTQSVCEAGACVVLSCIGDYENCDGQDSNGCEANLTRDDENCNGCGIECPQEYDCSQRTCVPDN